MVVNYFRVTDGSQEIPNNLLAGMLRCLYGQNLDFQALYPEVVYWFVEVEEGRVLREIGFNSQDAPLVIAPLGRNAGLWTTLRLGFGARDGTPVAKATFEEHWAKMHDRLAATVSPKPEEPFRPIETNADLLGLWTGDDLGIAFLGDGTGFFEASNYTLMFYDLFGWELHRGSLLTIRGSVSISRDEARNMVSTPSEFHYERVPVKIQTRFRGDGTAFEVLVVPLRNERWNWIADAYVRSPVPLGEVKIPSFD